MKDTKDPGSIPGGEDPPEQETTARSSVLAWKAPWTEGLAGCGAGGTESGTRPSGRAVAAADVWLTRQSVQRQTATYLNARPINNRNRSLLI